MEHKDCPYEAFSEAADDLRGQGYSDELMITEEGILEHTAPLDPALFTIDSFHRWEGPSDPADMCIVCAISSEAMGLKGLLVDGYGINGREVVQRMVRRLPAHEEDEIVQPVQPAIPGAIPRH